MPAKRPTRPAVRPRVLAPVTGDVTSFTQRLIADSASRASDQLHDRSSTVVNLVVGANVINHGLGRKPRGAQITPSVADATWAFALTAADDRQATITCVGVAQPNAFVEFIG